MYLFFIRICHYVCKLKSKKMKMVSNIKVVGTQSKSIQVVLSYLLFAKLNVLSSVTFRNSKLKGFKAESCLSGEKNKKFDKWRCVWESQFIPLIKSLVSIFNITISYETYHWGVWSWIWPISLDSWPVWSNKSSHLFSIDNHVVHKFHWIYHLWQWSIHCIDIM